MCKIVDKFTDSETATGYKVVIVDKYGKYYSPFTGIRYKIGKIPVPKIVISNNKYGFLQTQCNNKYINPNWKTNGIAWNAGMKNKTGILLNIKDAIRCCKNWDSPNDTKMAVLEMTISGDLYYATFADNDTVIGNTIESFKKIKQS